MADERERDGATKWRTVGGGKGGRIIGWRVMAWGYKMADIKSGGGDLSYVTK